MANKPLVSIIIPVFNDSSQLEKCLEALNDQTFGDGYEIIVVDNGSSPPVLLNSCHNNVSVIREDKVGAYSARNKGIIMAKGSVLAFTDADCIPGNGWIACGIQELSESKGSILAGDIEIIFRDEKNPNIVELYEYYFSLQQKRNVEVNGFGATANLFVRKGVFEEIGLFDDRLKSGGDREWGRRATSKGYKILLSERAYVMHPAKYRLADIIKKSSRMAGGFYDSGLLHDEITNTRNEVVKKVSLSLSTLNRIVDKIRYIHGNRVHGGSRILLGVLVVSMLVVMVRKLEIMRLYLGGKAKRA